MGVEVFFAARFASAFVGESGEGGEVGWLERMAISAAAARVAGSWFVWSKATRRVWSCGGGSEGSWRGKTGMVRGVGEIVNVRR